MTKGLQGLLFAVLLISIVGIRVYAGTVTGQIQFASSGRGVPNGTLTFNLTQAAIVAGQGTVVTSGVNCYTDALGNIVGLPNPLTAPSLSSNGSGSLPAGNYFVRTTWANSSGESVASPERSIVTTLAGALVVQVPANPPANATQWKIYVSTATGTETLQSTQAAPFVTYSQSTALVSGAALPAANTSTCSLRFNDELQPSYTGYNVTFTTTSGASIPGFPQKWYLAGGTVNVSNGTPLYSGTVVYPQAVLTMPAGNALQSISGPLSLGGFKLSTSNVNGFVYVDGINFTTIQQAITSVCAAGGGTVLVQPGSYPQNSSFTLCSNLTLIGAGRGQADVVNCPTTITTSMTSGDLFPITNMNDIHLSDFCIKNTATAGANAAIRLNPGQRNIVERLYIQGLFAVCIQLNTSSTSPASTIWNDFRDIHCTGLAPSGIGLLMDSTDATSKVINNNTFWNVSTVGGPSGVGIKITNNGLVANQVINENVIYGGEIAAAGGTGLLITATATRGTTFIEPNIEASSTGFNKAAGNVVVFVGGNFSANTTNVADAQPSFTSFIGTNVAPTIQQFSINPAGDLNVDGVGLNGTGISNAINGVSGWGLDVSGVQKWDVLTGALAPHTAGGVDLGTTAQPVGNVWIGNAGTNNIKLTGTGSAARVAMLPDNSGTLAELNLSQTWTTSQKQGNNGTFVGIHQHLRASTGSIGATTRTEVLLGWISSMNDANYTVACSVEDPTTAAGVQGLIYERIRTKSASQVGLVINNPTGAAITGTIDCVADHD
jgi:hypothetical protein